MAHAPMGERIALLRESSTADLVSLLLRVDDTRERLTIVEAENERLKLELKEERETMSLLRCPGCRKSVKRAESRVSGLSDAAALCQRKMEVAESRAAELETELNAILAMVNLDKGGQKSET